jgi:hypothetical protein
VDADCFYFFIFDESYRPVYNVRKVVPMPDHIITIMKNFNNWEEHIIFIRARRRQSPRTLSSVGGPAFVVDIALLQEKLYVLVGRSGRHLDLYAMDTWETTRSVLACNVYLAQN